MSFLSITFYIFRLIKLNIPNCYKHKCQSSFQHNSHHNCRDRWNGIRRSSRYRKNRYNLFGNYPGILRSSFLRNFLPVVKAETEKNGNESELSPKQIFDLFDDKYINVLEPYGLKTFSETQDSEQISTVSAVITDNGKEVKIGGTGNGLLDAFVTAFKEYTGVDFEIKDYSEHAMKSGSDSAAITFIEIRNKEDGKVYVGAGGSSSVTKSSVRAIVSAYNRMISVIK